VLEEPDIDVAALINELRRPSKQSDRRAAFRTRRTDSREARRGAMDSARIGNAGLAQTPVATIP
jgi:hypothetical protein